MYSKILVAVDGSENNKPAVRKAIRISKDTGAKLTAAYVEAIGYNLAPNVATVRDPLKNADEVFSFMRSEADAAGVEVDYKVMVGHPGEALTDLASDFDLVVCGTLGRSGLKKAVMGSVSEMISRYASCDVLIVRK
ncbi:MAG: universal stress protein [Candidatus Methanomethylophilaceae archaeon]|jgi:nucleotide-binding universal stress UspA family protein|nr:universal stress protein [Candidatus Methanomethylophilaceae archaeon]